MVKLFVQIQRLQILKQLGVRASIWGIVGRKLFPLKNRLPVTKSGEKYLCCITILVRCKTSCKVPLNPFFFHYLRGLAIRRRQKISSPVKKSQSHEWKHCFPASVCTVSFSSCERQRMLQAALFSLVSVELESSDDVKTKRKQNIKCAFTRGHVSQGLKWRSLEKRAWAESTRNAF